MRRGRTCSGLLIAGLAGVLALLAVFGPPRRPATARQASDSWSTPLNLSNSETMSDNPALAVDPSGGVHVVWTEITEDGRSFISYTQLVDGNWSAPNEIVASPITQVADSPTLAADSQGYLHLAWRGDSTLYYSKVYAPLAASALNWSEPQVLEYFQSDLGHPYLIVDDQDVLHLVYAITIGSSSGIFSMQSGDGGDNWSDPVTIYKNNYSNRTVDFPRLAAGPDGSLHAVWVEFNYPEIFPPIGIRYPRSEDEGQTWSESLSLADGPYHYPAVTTRGQNEVHVVYSGTSPDRYKFHRWSADGGQTWPDPFRNTEVGGYQGLPDLAVDSAGTLHWLTTATVYSINTDSLYHTAWQAGAWTPGEVLLRVEVSQQNPRDVAAEAALGNQLHVVVQYPVASDTQPDGWQNEIYYVRGELNSPSVAAAALPTPTVSRPTPTATAPRAVPTARPTLDAWMAAPPTSSGGGMLNTLVISLVAALVVVAGVTLLVRRSQR